MFDVCFFLDVMKSALGVVPKADAWFQGSSFFLTSRRNVSGDNGLLALVLAAHLL